MCYCDPPQAFNQYERRAKSAHLCCECGGVIDAGNRYQYTSGVWDGQGASFKTCLRCVGVRSWFIAEYLPRYECEPCIGELYQEAYDAEVGRSVPDVTYVAAEAGYL